MTRAKLNSVFSQIKHFVKQQDSFGHPINIRYNEQTTFKSFLGGFFSLISKLGLIIYFGVLCKNVIDKENTIVTSQKIINTQLDETQYQVELGSDFDFAMRINYIGYQDYYTVNSNLHQYLYPVVYQRYMEWTDINGEKIPVSTLTEIELVNCSYGRFNNEQETTKVLGIQENYKCANNTNKALFKGGWGSQKILMLLLQVKKCTQDYLNKHYPGQKCKNNSEIERVLDNTQVFIPVMTQYFNENDLSDEPISSTILMQYFTLHPTLSQSYSYKVSRNFAVLQDSFLANIIDNKNLTFYQIRLDQQYSRNQDADYNSPVQIHILLDENIRSVTRTVYTISDALSSTGGILQIINVVILFLLSGFQEYLFNSSIIRKVYLVQGSTHQNLNRGKTVKIKPENSEPDQPSQDLTSSDKDYFNTLFESIQLRSSFIYRFKEFWKSTLTNWISRRKNFRYLTYKSGVQKLYKELEISTLIKQIRTIKLLSHIFLAKYQRHLIPYFQGNMIDGSQLIADRSCFFSNRIDSGDDDFKPLNQKGQEVQNGMIKQYLKKVFDKSQNNKIDKRILKNLDQDASLIKSEIISFKKSDNQEHSSLSLSQNLLLESMRKGTIISPIPRRKLGLKKQTMTLNPVQKMAIINYQKKSLEENIMNLDNEIMEMGDEK